ncbi:MAG: dihydrofolate reductase family protein, partial [Dehalococcoidia bacterium]
DQDAARTIVATTRDADREKLSSLERMGIEVLIVDSDEWRRVELGHLLKELGRKSISSVLAEGGAGIITSLIAQGQADKLVAIVAPRIMGSGIDTIGDLGTLNVDQALRLSFDRVYRSGDDLVIEARRGTRD